MQAQVEHLVEMAARANVVVQVIPTAWARMRAWPEHL